MKAYHGDPAVKAEYLARVRAHRAADELIRGTYWEGGKGCAVGCTIHGDDHARYERELGIPAAIAHLEDRIFEGLPDAEAMAWPERFLDAIPVGADLSRVADRFAHWLLSEEVPRHFDAAAWPDVAAAVSRAAELRRRAAAGEPIDAAEWPAAEAASRSAARSAASAAARSAARSAASAAARSAEWSADSAELAASAAARSAAEPAAARSAAYRRMADRLAALLEGSP